MTMTTKRENRKQRRMKKKNDWCRHMTDSWDARGQDTLVAYSGPFMTVEEFEVLRHCYPLLIERHQARFVLVFECI